MRGMWARVACWMVLSVVALALGAGVGVLAGPHPRPMPVLRTVPATRGPRFVVLDDYIRDTLAKAWDAVENDPLQHERGYCLRWQLDVFAGEWAYRVTQILPPDSITMSSPSRLGLRCPVGPQTATLHVHPPTTCLSDVDCIHGSTYAYQCMESDADTRFLAFRGEPFGLIQCSREGIFAYWPHGQRGASP